MHRSHAWPYTPAILGGEIAGFLYCVPPTTIYVLRAGAADTWGGMDDTQQEMVLTTRRRGDAQIIRLAVYSCDFRRNNCRLPILCSAYADYCRLLLRAELE